jgi:hypothetical protein
MTARRVGAGDLAYFTILLRLRQNRARIYAGALRHVSQYESGCVNDGCKSETRQPRFVRRAIRLSSFVNQSASPSPH